MPRSHIVASYDVLSHPASSYLAQGIWILLHVLVLLSHELYCAKCRGSEDWIRARSFGRSFLYVEGLTLLGGRVALSTNYRLVQSMFLLKYWEFCLSVKAFTDWSSMVLSISTSVSLLTRILQHRESCTDVSTSLGKLAKREFLLLSQKTSDCHVFYSKDTCVLIVRVLILSLALLFFANS